jgi:hypothetical protein
VSLRDQTLASLLICQRSNRRTEMTRMLSVAAAAAAVLAIAYAGPAKADCWFNGVNWQCTPNAMPGPGYYGAPYWGGYAAPGYYAPETYPYDYKPAWYPSLPGPRASSGAGR